MKILSILIPIYNGRFRIDSLITSLYTKGFVDNTQVEIIISDNFSSDGTREYLDLLPRSFNISYNEKNHGYSGNAVKLLKLSKGKYTWLIGDDDIVNVTANILLKTIIQFGVSSKQNIFVEKEEYNIVREANVASHSSLIMPFGFIASTIQPNTDEFIELFEFYSRTNQKHDSPHFFARWQFYLKHNISSIISLGDIVLLSKPPSRPTNKLISLFLLMSKVYKPDYSYNWYNAYHYASKSAALQLPASLILKTFHNQMSYDLKTSFLRSTLYWFMRLPFLIAKDYRYAGFLVRILLNKYVDILSKKIKLLIGIDR